MVVMARAKQAKLDLQTYFQQRAKGLSESVLDAFEDLFSEESAKRHREFEDRVERRLRNGAKFIPRRRNPR
jgi:hypothetical protein